MKSVVLSVLLVLGAPVVSYAADLPPAAPPPMAPAFVPAPPPFTWTGIYVGINGGYSWGNIATTDTTGASPPASFNSNGGIVGGTFGFNYQIDQFVVGFDGDIDWSGMQFNASSTSSSFFGTSTASLTYKNDILSTFAARFGIAADRALFYAKGGGAWTEEKFDLSGTDPLLGSLSGSNSFSRLGWVVGAGVEYAVTDMITLKAEYNYIDFGTKDETLTANSSVIGPLTASISSNPTMNVVKVGLNVLFH